MPRLIRSGLVGLLAAATLATAALALASFARKVDSFSRAGFSYEVEGGALRVVSVKRGGAAARAGLSPGDRIVLADGRSAASLPNPERTLARKPFPHRLVVLSDGQIRPVQVGKPAVEIDRTYLFLALVGFLYLSIGLFTVARTRSGPSHVFLALCLASFAVYVVTPVAPVDPLYKAAWFVDAFFRALLPALLLHFFLVFPRRVAPAWLVPLLYLPAIAYFGGHLALLKATGPSTLARLETLTDSWYAYFGLYGVAVLVRLAALLSQRGGSAELEKQSRWIALGVAVGLTPFLILSVLPRAFGLSSPLLSSLAVLSLVLMPLAFAYAILKWRLWDVEIFVREALATTAAVLLGGMTFVLLNTLLDRTLEGMAEAGKNVLSFGSGLVLASLLVPVKRRITGVLEKIQYHDTYRARRALLDIARDFATPRKRADLVAAIVRRVEEGLHVVPCSLFLFDDGPEDLVPLLAERLEGEDIWRLKSSAFGESEPDAVTRLHAAGYRTCFALRCGGGLVGALGVGHKDGRVPLSTEDEALLVAVMAQAGLAYENARLYGALADRLDEIRSLQQYQESVIRSSSSGILVLDRENRVQSANPAFATLVGRPESELLGRPLSDILPGVEAGAPAADGSEHTSEARWINSDGEDRDLQLSVSAFQGDPDRRVLLVDDVTDRLRVERAAAERERLAALGVLAAGVAHEVNTPIAGLSSYAQMLLADTAPGDPRYAILKKMERQTFRAAHLVNNLLEFARPGPHVLSRTDLREVVTNAAESVETALGSRHIALTLEPGSEPLWVMGDPRDLEQVFINLLTNARDVSPEGGIVSCRLRASDGQAEVAICDSGPGVAPDLGGKLFQPFFTTKKTGGTGLGLAISREIVRRHGGEIGLTSREGGGAQAWVRLPLAEGTP